MHSPFATPRGVVDAQRETTAKDWTLYSYTFDLDKLADVEMPVWWVDGPTYFRLEDGDWNGWTLTARSAGKVHRIRTETGVTSGGISGGLVHEQRTTISPIDDETQEVLDVENTIDLTVSVDLSVPGRDDLWLGTPWLSLQHLRERVRSRRGAGRCLKLISRRTSRRCPR